ncbi:MAG: hypothetical protein ACI9ZF_001563 [Bradyrhizobium sp.]|jgi:hypothetical protein
MGIPGLTTRDDMALIGRKANELTSCRDTSSINRPENRIALFFGLLGRTTHA